MSNANGAPVTEPPVTTYVTPDGQTVQVPGQGVVTTLDTPPQLDAEMRAAFESAEYRTTTTAALLSDGVPSVDPRSDPAAAAAMAAAVGSTELPSVDPNAVTPSVAATAASVAAAAAPVDTSQAPPSGFVPPTGAPEPAAVTPPVAAAGSELPPPTPAADGYDFTYFDPTTQTEQTRHLSPQEIAEAVGLRGWVNGLTDQQKAAMAAIEAGQAVPVPRSDYDRFQAFINSQQPAPGAPGFPPNPAFDGRGPGIPGPVIDYNDLDPQTAAQVRMMEQQNALLQQQLYQQQVAEAQAAARQAAQHVDQNLASKAQAYDAAANAYAAQRGLTVDELNHLAEAAMRAEIVPVIERQHTTINPVNGQIVVPADPNQVVFEALDYALWRDPVLYQTVEARQHAQQTSQSTAPTANPQSPGQGNQATQPGVPAPSANGHVPIPDIAAKKAQAASLATAPSSAVTPAPIDVRTLTREQTATMMADDIARVWQQQ